MEEIDRQIDSFPKWIILKKISLLKREYFNSYSELANEIKVSPSNPYFGIIKEFLLGLGIMIKREVVGRNQMIYLDLRKAKILSRKSYYFREVEDFILKSGGIKIT